MNLRIPCKNWTHRHATDWLLLLLIIAASITGCSKAQSPSTSTQGPPSQNPTPPPAIAAASAPVPQGPAQFSVLAQSGQCPDWLKSLLTSKLGVPVQVQTVESPEQAVQALSASDSHFDLALVADRAVPALIHAKALRELPAFPTDGFDHRFLGHDFIDRDNRYSLPYGWNIYALAFHTTAKIHPQHWLDLNSSALLAQTVFVDQPVAKPLDANARYWANRRKIAIPSGNALSGTIPKVDPSAANCWAAPYGVLRTRFQGKTDWQMLIPEDGSIVILYNAILPISAQRPDLADRAISTLFDPAVAAHLDSDNAQAVTQPAALPLTPADQSKDPLLYPNLGVMDRCAFSHNTRP